VNYRHVLKFIDEMRMTKVINPAVLGPEAVGVKDLVSPAFMQDMYRTNYQASLERAVVVDCQNIVQMAIDHTKRPTGVIIGPEDFPRMRLPYPELWLEYVPTTTELKEKAPQIERVGVMARDLKYAVNAPEALRKQGNRRSDTVRPIELTLYLKVGGRCYGPQALMVLWVEDDGTLDTTAIINLTDRKSYNVQQGLADGIKVDKQGRATIGIQEGYMTEGMRASFAILLLPALYALQFMNCRNIEQEERQPPQTINERHRRQHPPLVRYRVLKINRRGPTSHAAKTTGDGQGLNAYHICRGHFKHFTAERPLLGKHTGTFWWEDQARGSKKNGEIIKDYEVRP